MKRVYISIIILVAVVAVAFFSYCAVNKELTDFKNKVIDSSAYISSEKYDKATEDFRSLYIHWQKTSNRLELIIAEDICNEVENELKGIIISIKESNITQAIQGSERVINIIDKINSEEKLSFDAVL